jgi:hypothetical protein
MHSQAFVASPANKQSLLPVTLLAHCVVRNFGAPSLYFHTAQSAPHFFLALRSTKILKISKVLLEKRLTNKTVCTTSDWFQESSSS